MSPWSLSAVWLTSVRPDGSPHTAPVGFVLLDDVVWVGTSRGAAKVRNLLADDRVSMAFDSTADQPWVAEGRAVLHEPVDRSRHAEVLAAFAAKYGGWDAADPTDYGPRVLLEIPVGRWLLRP